MGYFCVDGGEIHGTMGSDHEIYGLMALKKEGLFPIKDNWKYQEDEIFDLIEFLFDHVSKPTKGNYHSYDQCGWHYEEFDKEAGQMEFSDHVNRYLCGYGEGWILDKSGEIYCISDTGLETIFDADIPHDDKENINQRVTESIRKFRRYPSSIQDRKDAVRDLADVLEYLRPQAKDVLTEADERDLFNLANNFGIRHHNERQKNHYDQAVWLSWMFYYYLASIHATVRLIERSDNRVTK